jgi:hypothetical protein
MYTVTVTNSFNLSSKTQKQFFFFVLFNRDYLTFLCYFQWLTLSFSPNFKFKICQKFKISLSKVQYLTQFGHMAELNESELVLQKPFKKRYFPYQLILFVFKKWIHLIWPYGRIE